MRTDLDETTSEPLQHTQPRTEWLWAAAQSLQNSKTGETDGGRRGYSGGVTEIPSTPQSIQESTDALNMRQIFYLAEEVERGEERRGMGRTNTD